MTGHTHNMGWYNRYQIPFQSKVKITMTCNVDSPFWFRVAGVENYPIIVGDLQLPSHAKLEIQSFNATVNINDLVYVTDRIACTRACWQPLRVGVGNHYVLVLASST